MRYLALYNPTTKIVQYMENYDESDESDDGRNLYRHNLRRFIAEAMNRGDQWFFFDDTSTFSSKFSGYTGDALPNSLLLIGDSRTQGWASQETDYFSEYSTFHNRGVGGDTAANQAIVLPTWGLPKYEKVVVSIGINDWQNFYVNTISSIGQMISYLKTRAEKVYLTSIPTINPRIMVAYSVSQSIYNQILSHAVAVDMYIQQICVNYGIEFIELNGALWDSQTGLLSYSYDDNDGLHYNESAYAVIRQLYASHGI